MTAQGPVKNPHPNRMSRRRWGGGRATDMRVAAAGEARVPLRPTGVWVCPRHALEQKKWKEDPPSPSSKAGGSLSRGPGKFVRLTV